MAAGMSKRKGKTVNSVASLMSFTFGELLAMSKLVQMITHERQYDKINTQTWSEYLQTSLGISQEAANDLISKTRRAANRILKNATQ